MDQLNVIFDVIGTPNSDECGDMGSTSAYLRRLPPKAPRDLRKLFPGAHADALELLRSMLLFSPQRRISVEGALEHPFLKGIGSGIGLKRPDITLSDQSNAAASLSRDELKDAVYQEVKNFHELKPQRQAGVAAMNGGDGGIGKP